MTGKTSAQGPDPQLARVLRVLPADAEVAFFVKPSAILGADILADVLKADELLLGPLFTYTTDYPETQIDIIGGAIGRNPPVMGRLEEFSHLIVGGNPTTDAARIEWRMHGDQFEAIEAAAFQGVPYSLGTGSETSSVWPFDFRAAWQLDEHTVVVANSGVQIEGCITAQNAARSHLTLMLQRHADKSQFAITINGRKLQQLLPSIGDFFGATEPQSFTVAGSITERPFLQFDLECRNPDDAQILANSLQAKLAKALLKIQQKIAEMDQPVPVDKKWPVWLLVWLNPTVVHRDANIVRVTSRPQLPELEESLLAAVGFIKTRIRPSQAKQIVVELSFDASISDQGNRELTIAGQTNLPAGTTLSVSARPNQLDEREIIHGREVLVQPDGTFTTTLKRAFPFRTGPHEVEVSKRFPQGKGAAQLRGLLVSNRFNWGFGPGSTNVSLSRKIDVRMNDVQTVLKKEKRNYRAVLTRINRATVLLDQMIDQGAMSAAPQVRYRTIGPWVSELREYERIVLSPQAFESQEAAAHLSRLMTALSAMGNHAVDGEAADFQAARQTLKNAYQMFEQFIGSIN